MILPVYCYPQPVLSQPTQPITDITPEIRQLAADMRETMHNAEGVGLAAPQIGQSISLLVVEYDNPEDADSFPYMALVNPRITWQSSDSIEMIEGCLSLPAMEGPVRRPRRVRVKATNLEGKKVSVSAKGLLARVLQHEIDHLHGILFSQYVPTQQMTPKPLVEYPRY